MEQHEYRVRVADDADDAPAYSSTPRETLEDAEALVREYLEAEIHDRAWIERRAVGPWEVFDPEHPLVVREVVPPGAGTPQEEFYRHASGAVRVERWFAAAEARTKRRATESGSEVRDGEPA